MDVNMLNLYNLFRNKKNNFFSCQNRFIKNLGVLLYDINSDTKKNKITLTQPSSQIPDGIVPHIPIERRDEKGNVICIVYEDGTVAFPSKNSIYGMKIEWGGVNNTIVLYGKHQFLNCLLQTGGDSTFVIRESPNPICGLRFFAKWSPRNTFYIGKNFRCFGVDFRAAEADIQHYVGDNCLFSYDVTLRSTDAHSIFDKDMNLINRASNFYIGNHVWIGHHVEILKNACILDGTIIGACSLVVKKQKETNVILVGVPAKVLKRDVTWDFKSPWHFDKMKNRE